MTRAEKIEAAAERMLAATDGVEWFGVAIGATSLDMERSRSILGARMALRAALSSPASPGPEPRAMEEIERLVGEYHTAIEFMRQTGMTERHDNARAALLAAIRRALGSASPGERRELGGEAKDYRTLAFPVRILATSKPPGLPRGKSDLWATWDREFDALSAAETPPAPAAPPESSPDDAARWVKALKQVGLPVPPGFEKAMRAAPPESSGAEKEEP